MQQKRHRWDALVRMVALQHVLRHASGIALEDVMHCVVTHVTMTAQELVRVLVMAAAKEVADTN